MDKEKILLNPSGSIYVEGNSLLLKIIMRDLYSSFGNKFSRDKDKSIESILYYMDQFYNNHKTAILVFMEDNYAFTTIPTYMIKGLVVNRVHTVEDAKIMINYFNRIHAES